MFKTELTRLSLAIPAFLMASQASAHSSGHAELTVSQVISHLVTSPFHAGVIAVSVLMVASLIALVAQYKVTQRAAPKGSNT